MENPHVDNRDPRTPSVDEQESDNEYRFEFFGNSMIAAADPFAASESRTRDKHGARTAFPQELQRYHF